VDVTTLEERHQAPPPQAGGRGARAGGAGRRPNIFSRIRTYVREVVAELRKVIYPGRQQLLTYTVVVLVFVAVVVAIVAGLDYGLTKAILAIFG
jgi:preprotein translocase subunit SecE